MASNIRVTVNVAKVLRAFLEDPDEPRFGYDLMKTTGMSSGAMYPVLARLEIAEWITGSFEDIDSKVAGRPARRFYRFTPEGKERGQMALAELHEQTRLTQPGLLGPLSLRPEKGPA